MFLLPGWLQSAAYSLLLGDSLLSDRTTWGHLWGRQVDLFVIFIIVLTDHDCHNSQDYNSCSLDHRHNKNLGLAGRPHCLHPALCSQGRAVPILQVQAQQHAFI